jgi:hypothetical protein
LDLTIALLSSWLLGGRIGVESMTLLLNLLLTLIQTFGHFIADCLVKISNYHEIVKNPYFYQLLKHGFHIYIFFC